MLMPKRKMREQMFSTMVVGDLFEETDDWVNDEEAQTFTQIEDLIREFIKDTGKKPTKLYVSDSEENQSYLLWFGKSFNLETEKTKKATYLE